MGLASEIRGHGTDLRVETSTAPSPPDSIPCKVRSALRPSNVTPNATTRVTGSHLHS